MFLSDYLKNAGITQRRFAQECGLSPAAVTRLLKGQRFPSPETMFTIHQVTGGKVGAEDFFRQRVEAGDGRLD